MKKIYIIGAVGTGKTTLAKKMSEQFNISMYELDKVVWDDDSGNIKRSDDVVRKMFEEILAKDSWIIEDVGRKKFRKGITEADMVYYINLPSFTVYKRCIFRWIKQKLGKESYNYKPTVKGLVLMLKWAHSDMENKDEKINYIKENAKKYKILKRNDINFIDRS